MQKQTSLVVGLVIMSLVLVTLIGCGGNNSTSALAPFEPEIINNADAFQFQATGVNNVSTTVTYTWANTGTQATINHSSALTSGTAIVTLYDNDTTQVYQSGLVASANEPSSVGTAGTWTVKVELTNVVGTLNFRIQKL